MLFRSRPLRRKFGDDLKEKLSIISEKTWDQTRTSHTTYLKMTCPVLRGLLRETLKTLRAHHDYADLEYCVLTGFLTIEKRYFCPDFRAEHDDLARRELLNRATLAPKDLPLSNAVVEIETGTALANILRSERE